MKLMEGKRGIVFGISNRWGIAYGISKSLVDHGADVALCYAGEFMKDRVMPIAEELKSSLVLECDVAKDDAIQNVFDSFKKTFGRLDFVLHAVAFAKREDLNGSFASVQRDGWDLALGISAYSLVPISRCAQPLMTEGGAIATLTYIGGERTVPNYNIMGVAKAALECTVRYLASEMGPHGIRVNALSAGPVKTLAAKGITGFNTLIKITSARSPLRREVTLEEVGNTGLFLLSPLSSGITGETLHVDCGLHSVAITREDARIVGVDPSTGSAA